MTPFTHDYDNIFSIGQTRPGGGFDVPRPGEPSWPRHRGHALFKAFIFDASGNVMVIFSDVEIDRAMIGGRSLTTLVSARRRFCHLVRINYDRAKGHHSRRTVDPAVEKPVSSTPPIATGPAQYRDTSLSTGKIEVRQHSSQQPAVLRVCLDCRGSGRRAAAANLPHVLSEVAVTVDCELSTADCWQIAES